MSDFVGGVSTRVIIVVVVVLFVLGVISSVYMWTRVKCDPGKIKQSVNGTVLCIDPNNPPVQILKSWATFEKLTKCVQQVWWFVNFLEL